MLFQLLSELKDAPGELRSFDPYEILGLQKGAELREIKKAYHTKSLQHHPDKDFNSMNITKGSFSSLSSITALAVFFSRGGRALSAAKVCF